ncbi:MAG: aminotransferase class I/II-fold pyridoxal phosphate-dependent enzyme [Clostridia bacterium]|nr:aminotransferase class I/II-fold pyridoxal phosphate-dependent enzyme [Clostridia bacterium]MBR6783398.1 aminotransferase class I/II-fold pyridoxal phosphate-dependent enzyme [Clostridia bacterium]
MNKQELQKKYDEYKAMGLKLDMSRGKPSPEQVSTMERLLTAVKTNEECFSETGSDCRNYGGLDGINEMKRLLGEMLGVTSDHIIVGGNSSLNLMYDTVARSMLHPVEDGCKPWSKYDQITFLCPVPGYDRHFAICEFFGIKMVNIPLTEEGPDMDLVESLVANDETVKGMWCVPKYSNPSGFTYSKETVRRIASLRPAAKDFRVFWDNAYVLHDLTDTPDELPEIFSEAEKYGNEDMFFEFASTSKITFPGSGVSCIAASPRNIKRILNALKIQTIGHDKLNQLRHSRVFKCYDDIVAQMKVHMNIIRPKFQIIYEAFENGFEGYDNVTWTIPNGGYFFCLSLPNGTAKRTVELCKEAGLVVTPAGAMFPYGIDPDDSKLRIAPTFPSCDELAVAADLLTVCARLAIAEKYGE